MHQSCEIILDSIVGGERITTVRYEIWRALHSELLTYRRCSRNASSSRAIPFKKNYEKVMTDPFIPPHIGKEHKGMSPSEWVDDYTSVDMEIKLWAEKTAEWTKYMSERYGVAKSILNRYLEPFNTINVLMTGSSEHWHHVFAQRITPEAEPNLRELVEQIKEAYDTSIPIVREAHLPYVTEEEQASQTALTQANLSAARCARLSYTPFGEPTINTVLDLELAEKLKNMGHRSPHEHQVFSIAKSVEVFPNSLPGKNAISENVVTYREMIEGEF